jgi:4-amino-4-deoxy-L-arabinose transferase-like glycosyltransferase
MRDTYDVNRRLGWQPVYNGRDQWLWPMRLAYCGLLWLGFALALRLLDRFALREDEAIYSYWALHSWRIDPYFLTVWPDKPPLFLWLLAGALELWGASQAGGRLLNVMVTLLTALVVGATACRLWGRQHGLVATALYLFNPFALSFAATVYTDPLLVLAGQLALFCAIGGRGLGAGLWLAAAIMTKQQGVFYIPLVMLALWLRPCAPMTTPAPRAIRRSIAHWLWFVGGLLLVIAPLVYWDSTRWAVAPSPWDLSVRNYGGLELAAFNQWLPRAYEWAKLLWYLTASWPAWLLLTGMIIAALWQSRSAVSGTLLPWLVLWCGGFLALHTMTTVQIWDRYLLPLAPPLCLLATWGVMALFTPLTWQLSVRRLALGLVGLLTFLPPALTATSGGLPIGGDHGAYNGLTATIARLQQVAPADAILYHQRLGWHYQFYLFDEVASGAYDLRWYPTAIYLAANATQSPNRPRFLLLPAWAPQPDLPLHLATRRLSLQQIAQVDQMTLYRIANQPQASCRWCRCQRRAPWPLWPTFALSEEAH